MIVAAYGPTPIADQFVRVLFEQLTVLEGPVAQRLEQWTHNPCKPFWHKHLQ